MKHAHNEEVKSVFAAIEKPDFAKVEHRVPSVARLSFNRMSARTRDRVYRLAPGSTSKSVNLQRGERSV